MSAEAIKSFLVNLGFKVDTKGQRDFTDAIAQTTVKVAELGAAVAVTAAAVTAGVAKIADELETLYFASQRTKASVENIQATGFAARQMGSSAEASLATLESLAKFMRTNPGGEGLINTLGVRTRDANGALRDTSETLAELGKQFAGMPYYRAKAYADVLGIDEKTLMALTQGMGEFSDEYRGMLQAANVDSQEAAKSSHEFMVQVRTLTAGLQILAMKVASSLTGSMGASIKRFRENLVDNFDKIAATIAKIVKAVLFVADIISTLALRAGQAIGIVVNWFIGLDEKTQKTIAAIGALIVVWKLLNGAFLTSPIGRVIALLTALLLLFDDYQTYKEGGESLIDWKKWEPAIAVLKQIVEWLGKVMDALGGWQTVLAGVATYMAASWAASMIGSVMSVFGAVSKLSGAFGGLGVAAKAGLVGAAGAAGYAVGTVINDKLVQDTKFGDAIGKGITKAMAFFGHEGAQQALAGYKSNEESDRRIANAIARGTMKAPINVAVPTTAVTPPAATRPTGAREPRGIRNNNPGNLNYVGQAGAVKEAGEAGRFAVFQTAEEGLRALADQLKRYGKRGIDSVQAIISKFAPESENNTKAYIASVAKGLGVEANAALDLNDPKVLSALMNAIIKVENAKNPYSQEQITTAAGGQPTAVSAPGAGATMQQTTNITVHGATDPKATASAIGAEQNGVNARIIRNMGGAIG